MTSPIRSSLAQDYDAILVDELLAAYEEAKTNYYQGGHRLSAVEGGRFCEAAFRLLEQRAFGTFTPIGQTLDTEGLFSRLTRIPKTSQPSSIRLYIPRGLRVVYDIRNNRDTAHLADGIDPNIQDATLVITVISWVLAEFVRLHHKVSPKEAQRLVDDLSTRKAPIIQEFDGFIKVLRPEIRASDLLLMLLYHVGAKGATFLELSGWVRPQMRTNLRRTLSTLDEKALVHRSSSDDRYLLTRLGGKYVEDKQLLEP